MFVKVQTCWKWKYFLSQLLSDFSRSPVFLLSQLMYLKKVDISLQIWSTKDQTPTEASWEACALGRWISVLSCIIVSCGLGCVPTGWNDVKQARVLSLCLSSWAQSPSAVGQKFPLLPPLSLHGWPVCCCLCSRMCSPSGMLRILETLLLL